MPGIGPTLREFNNKTLHSGSKDGPLVKSRKQAIAIGMNDTPPRKKGRGIAALLAHTRSRVAPRQTMGPSDTY